MIITRTLEQTMEESRERRETKVPDIYLVSLKNFEITKVINFIFTPY